MDDQPDQMLAGGLRAERAGLMVGTEADLGDWLMRIAFRSPTWIRIELLGRRRILRVTSNAPSVELPVMQRRRRRAKSARQRERHRTCTAKPKMRHAMLRMPLSVTHKTLMITVATRSATARRP